MNVFDRIVFEATLPDELPETIYVAELKVPHPNRSLQIRFFASVETAPFAVFDYFLSDKTWKRETTRSYMNFGTLQSELDRYPKIKETWKLFTITRQEYLNWIMKHAL